MKIQRVSVVAGRDVRSPCKILLTTILQIFIYPVKSLRPVEVKATEITNEGLRFDRQYVLVKPPTPESNGLAEHITIKWNYQLSLFETAIDKSWSKLTITHIQAPERRTITVPLTPSPLALLNAEIYQVSIFGTKAPGIDMGEEFASFFTHHLQIPTRLLYIGGNGQREIPGAVFTREYRSLSISVNDKMAPQRIRFADAAPLLITSTASEEDARRRLPPSARGEDLIVRFRPNIHIDVGDEQKPYEEDSWNMLAIRSQTDPEQEISVRCLFRTVRCLSLNVDMAKGGRIATNRQLYGLLAKDRRVNDKFPHKPVFGQYACAGPSGAVLRVGDEVEITERVNPDSAPMTPELEATGLTNGTKGSPSPSSASST